MANSNFRAPDPNAAPSPANGHDARASVNGGAANGGAANGGAANGGAANGAGSAGRGGATPLHRLKQSEGADETHLRSEAREGERDQRERDYERDERGRDYGRDESERRLSLALYDDEGAGAGRGASIESADDAAMREFYGRLVNLLTQDGEGGDARKKGRGTLMTALRRRALPALLVAGLAFYGLHAALKPRQVTYSASTVLLLPPRAAKGTGANADPLTPPEDAYDTQAQLAIIGSQAIVGRALAKVPPALRQAGWGDPKTAMAPVSVSAPESDSLVNIVATSADPRASLRLVSEMVGAYASYSANRYSQNKTQNLTSTRQRVQKAQRDLEAARRARRDFKARTGVFNAQAQQSSSAANISELENALASARREAAGAASQDPTLGTLRQNALTARTNLSNVLRDFEPSSDRARAAQADFDRAQAQANDRQTQLEEAGARQIAQLEASLRAARADAARLPEAERELDRLNQRVDILDQQYTAASARASALDLAGGAALPVAKPLGTPGVKSDYPLQRARSLGVSLLGALVLGLVCALVLDRLDRSVRASSDPETLFGAPILGALPAMSARGARFIGHARPGGSARARVAILEACYTAQTHILNAAAPLGARSILITSSLPEEGKSQCAANLAAAMAYGGRQVLLIDADFWHPSQHQILEQELAPGYAQLLRDELPPSQAIRSTGVPNLHLLTAGARVNPKDAAGPQGAAALSALLRGEEHFQLQRLFKHYFDVIIVDAPPTMSVSDAQLLAGLTDATVLVAADHTNRDQVARARSMLRLSGAVLLGVIVNSVRMGEVERWNVDFTPEEPFSNYGTALSRR